MDRFEILKAAIVKEIDHLTLRARVDKDLTPNEKVALHNLNKALLAVMGDDDHGQVDRR